MKQPFKDHIYQGFQETNQYFEGWYFKQVSLDGKTIISLIPGISKSKKDPHAFIQIFLVDRSHPQASLETDYVRFPVDAFSANKIKFEVSIGNNYFSNDTIRLSLKGNRIPIHGEITFLDKTALPRSLYQPSIMGPFAYLPLMECYHGVVSMNHRLKGSLKIREQLIDFDKGKGYIEKDYGRSFPSAYVWIQANHFSEEDASLFFSYATIPYLGLKFSGLICNWYFKRHHVRFATYNFASIRETRVSPHHVLYDLKKSGYRLTIDAKVHEVVTLPAPKNGQMSHAIKEGLSGTVHIRFFKRGKLIYEGQSSHAGIEIMKEMNHVK